MTLHIAMVGLSIIDWIDSQGIPFSRESLDADPRMITTVAERIGSKDVSAECESVALCVNEADQSDPQCIVLLPSAVAPCFAAAQFNAAAIDKVCTGRVFDHGEGPLDLDDPEDEIGGQITALSHHDCIRIVPMHELDPRRASSLLKSSARLADLLKRLSEAGGHTNWVVHLDGGFKVMSPFVLLIFQCLGRTLHEQFGISIELVSHYRDGELVTVPLAMFDTDELRGLLNDKISFDPIKSLIWAGDQLTPVGQAVETFLSAADSA